MMGLLSSIRGKKDVRVIGTAEVGPIANRERKMVIQEWPRLLAQQPDLFKIVWIASANRSNSIKKAFGIADHEAPESNKVFVALHSTIEAFFYKLIVSYQLDEALVVSTCEQLGCRHVDFISRGFHSNFWDIFLVCMAETIDNTLSSYFSDDARRAEMVLAWQRVVNAIIHHMRAGYSERRRAQIQLKNGV